MRPAAARAPITAPAMSLAQDSLMPQPERIPVGQVCLEVIFWMLDVEFWIYRIPRAFARLYFN